MKKILNHQPLLAKSSRIVLYSRQIDKSRYYSNFGPFYNLCKHRLEKYLNLNKNNILVNFKVDTVPLKKV